VPQRSTTISLGDAAAPEETSQVGNDSAGRFYAREGFKPYAICLTKSSLPVSPEGS
jgi:hypothetical protein